MISYEITSFALAKRVQKRITARGYLSLIGYAAHPILIYCLCKLTQTSLKYIGFSAIPALWCGFSYSIFHLFPSFTQNSSHIQYFTIYKYKKI